MERNPFSSYVVTTTIHRLSRPFLRFLEIEASSGVVLLLCAALALLFANSPWASIYQSIWHIPISFGISDFYHKDSLQHWINDGLMSVFFFVVGLEIKREMTHGEFRNLKAALLPIFAALGGMIVPATIYALILFDQPGIQGWGIPMATDIAFVVGFLALLGKRVPRALKIFLLSLAIADDIGAVTVIALFYTTDISFAALSLGGLGFLVIVALNRLGVRQIPVYAGVGALIWLAFVFSGVHPTVAFVLLSLLTPANAWVGDTTFSEALTFWLKKQKAHNLTKSHGANQINGLIHLAKESVSPLERLEVALHPWVAFFIMPIFALANAGVVFSTGTMSSRIFFGVACGLFLGKVLGIMLFCYLAVRFFGCRLPTGTNWTILFGSAFLGGIGFTMSIFITGLALEGSQLTQGVVGTLFGSTLSALAGMTILHFALKAKDI
jgi:NhaA family Na+:H+ antiporter